MSDLPSAVTTEEWLEVIDAADSSPVIIHAPHGGSAVPSWAAPAYTIGAEELREEQRTLEDHRTDEMARAAAGAARCSAVISRISRFVIDVERFDSDEEEMLQVGMGMLYTHGTRRQRIRTVPAELEERLRAYYREYGALVTDLTARALEAHGRAFIIDLHSYPTLPLASELHAIDERPPLSVGYERLHIDEPTRAAVREAFGFLEQSDNKAFRGSYVPLAYYGTDARVRSMMLELRRDQYLVEPDEPIPGRVERMTEALTELVRALAAPTAAV